MSLNPFDENAIEEAVRIKETGKSSEIFVVSIGNEKCVDTLRIALARGCDRGILVDSADISLEPIHIAKILKQIVIQEQPDLILIGKQAIDDDANQVGQMLAAMLDYPQATFISKLQVNDNTIIVSRELDNGTENLQITLPAVVTADLYLNEPRFIKLPQLMLAKKKSIDCINLSQIGVSIKPSTRLLNATDGEVKRHCTMLNDTKQIITILNKVI
jgi:electron transfer flavoprotein beta subunit